MSWVDLLEKLKKAFSTSHDIVDRREYNRVTYRMTVMAKSRWEKKAREARITDVGLGGLRLESGMEFSAGDNLQLLIPSAAMSGANLIVENIWRKRTKDGYTAGMKFVMDNPQQQAAVAKFLLEEVKLGVLNPAERRKYLRVSVDGDVRGRLFIQDGAKLDVTVQDLAMGGTRLISTEPVGENMQAVVKIALLAKQLPLEAAGKIVRYSPYQGGWELGMAFDPLPAAQADTLKKFLIQTLTAHRVQQEE